MARGDVVYVNLPAPISGSGREQAGHRPAIVVLSDASPRTNPMVMVVPLTSQQTALRFPFTFQIDPSLQNGLSDPSVALVFQLRAIDSKRITRTVGKLEKDFLSKLDNEMRRLLSL